MVKVGELPESWDDVCDARERECERFEVCSEVDDAFEFVLLNEDNCASRAAIRCWAASSLE